MTARHLALTAALAAVDADAADLRRARAATAARSGWIICPTCGSERVASGTVRQYVCRRCHHEFTPPFRGADFTGDRR